MNRKQKITLALMMLAALAVTASFAVVAFGQTLPTTRPAFPTSRPAVPVLAWDVPVGHMDKWKARGVNILIGAGLEGKKDQAELDAWVGKAAEKGLWVIVDPRQNKTYPNLWAFMMPDEVDAKQSSFKPAVERWDGWPPEKIKPFYDRFRAIDPNVPIFMSLAGPKITAGDRVAYYQSIAPFCDWWMEDGYPRNNNAQRYDENLWPGRAIDVLKQAAPAKPIVAMIEVGDQNLWNAPLGRGPTVDEVKSALSIAKTKGVNGYGVFSHYFSDAGGWAGWDSTPPDIAVVLTDEFNKLNPPVNQADIRITALEKELAATKSELATTKADLEQLRAGLEQATKPKP